MYGVEFVSGEMLLSPYARLCEILERETAAVRRVLEELLEEGLVDGDYVTGAGVIVDEGSVVFDAAGFGELVEVEFPRKVAAEEDSSCSEDGGEWKGDVVYGALAMDELQ